MSRLRLVLITRRFWPLVGGAEMTMANLSAALEERGHRITLLTAAWNPEWPREIQHRGVRVVRLPQSPRKYLGTWQYMRGVARWLRDHREEYDLVYVSMLKHDAYAALGAGRKLGRPVVLRAEGSGASGDVAWQKRGRFGGWIRQRCAQATAIVAPSPAIQQELAIAGYAVERLHFIANGVAAVPEPSPERRRLAREALGTAHPVLSLGNDTRLAVYTGRLSEEKGLTCLVDAWARVLKNRSNTRLWLVGEGPLRDTLAEQIERLHIRGRCVLVGSFDSVDELLTAADLFILPSHEEGMSVSLLEAMAHGLPVVASNIPGNRILISSPAEGSLVPPNDASALAAAIEEFFRQPEKGMACGAAARERARQYFSLSTMVDRHEQLFEQCLSHIRG